MTDTSYDDYLNDPFIKQLFHIMLERLNVNPKIKEHIKITHMINILNQSHLFSNDATSIKNKNRQLKKLKLNNEDFENIGPLLSMFIEIDVFAKEQYVIQHIQNTSSQMYRNANAFLKDNATSFENIKRINLPDFQRKHKDKQEFEIKMENYPSSPTYDTETIFEWEYSELLPFWINIDNYCFQIEQT